MASDRELYRNGDSSGENFDPVGRTLGGARRLQPRRSSRRPGLGIGTAPVGEDGETVGVGDPYAQTVRCIEILRRALEEAGSGLADVVRTRLFVTDISAWEAIGRAHGEAFGDVRPATAMVEVSALIAPDMLVEIEATAIVGSGDD